MRRLGSIILTFTSLLCMSSTANGQTPQSSGRAVKPKGRVLVNRLPGKVQGVALRNGAVRLRPGFKFVKQEDGTFAVARIKGGVGSTNVKGKWFCDCPSTSGTGSGTCSVTITGSMLVCLAGTCAGNCVLTTTVDGLKTGVIMF